jgi:hypothetical protein
MLRWHRDKREFYSSLWACAEDSCCIIDDMFEVKLTAWASPMDADMTIERFEGWRDELVECGKLIPYEVDGRRYFFIPTMAEHEKPRNPQSPDWPLPPWIAFDVAGDGRNRRCTYSFSAYESTVQSDSGNRNTSPALPCPVLPCPDLPSPERGTDARAAFDAVWEIYPNRTFRDQALEAYVNLLEPDDRVAFAAAVAVLPADYSQTMRFFIQDGTWQTKVPKPKRGICPKCKDEGVIYFDDGSWEKCDCTPVTAVPK